LPLLILATLFGCSDDSGQMVNLFLNDIVINTDAAVMDSISRLETVEQKIDAVRIKRNALEQVAAPARAWLADQEEQARKYDWSRKTLMVIEDLPKLRNDKYEVAKLGFAMEIMGSYKTVIDIKDLATGQIESYEKTREAIDEEEYTLVQEGNLISASIDKSSGAISQVMDRYGEIQAARINANSYKIVGPLGLDNDGNLVQSQWVYDIALYSAKPAHQQATQLQRILECR
jgi:vacuolar-type H+-ATPase subunit I/STV1